MKKFKEFFEDFSHYPELIDPKKDKSEGDWITGDPTKPIDVSDKDEDMKSTLDKANKDVEKERKAKIKPFVESHKKESVIHSSLFSHLIGEKDDKTKGDSISSNPKMNEKYYKKRFLQTTKKYMGWMKDSPKSEMDETMKKYIDRI